MEKISIEEYKKALDTVTMFHEQLSKDAKNVVSYIENKKGKELLIDLLLKENNNRFFNAVKRSYDLNKWLEKAKIPLEECTVEGFIAFIKQSDKSYMPSASFRGIGVPTFNKFLNKLEDTGYSPQGIRK